MFLYNFSFCEMLLSLSGSATKVGKIPHKITSFMTKIPRYRTNIASFSCYVVDLSLSIRDVIFTSVTISDKNYRKENELKADRPHPHDQSKHRQTPRTENESFLLFSFFFFHFTFAALGKVEPLVSTATRQAFDLDIESR